MSTTPAEITISTIDTQCKNYAAKRLLLSERVLALQSELAEVQRRHIAGIKGAANSCKDQLAELRTSLEASPTLFLKPKTLTLHGIKVGFQKGSGKLVWDIEDEELVKRIKRMFAQEACDALIITTEKPAKDALENLPAADLKRLGITVEGTGDQVLVKTADTAIDKLVAKIVKEGATPVDE